MKKIFCVEDDANIRELLEYALKSSGFEVKSFDAGVTFLTFLEKEQPDLVLLDIMLPDMDGMQILNELKSKQVTERIPVIMLTAKSGRMDKIKGLDCGADDYITKPFDILELVSRINAVLRRVSSTDLKSVEKSAVYYKNISIDTDSRTVSVEGNEIVLTYKEFELLYFLVTNKGIVLTRDKIMNEVWGTDFEGESRTVDVHIRTLRSKLESAGEHIITVRNVGYKAEA